jgi:hypothetical protein
MAMGSENRIRLWSLQEKGVGRGSPFWESFVLSANEPFRMQERGMKTETAARARLINLMPDTGPGGPREGCGSDRRNG